MKKLMLTVSLMGLAATSFAKSGAHRPLTTKAPEFGRSVGKALANAGRAADLPEELGPVLEVHSVQGTPVRGDLIPRDVLIEEDLTERLDGRLTAADAEGHGCLLAKLIAGSLGYQTSAPNDALFDRRAKKCAFIAGPGIGFEIRLHPAAGEFIAQAVDANDSSRILAGPVIVGTALELFQGGESGGALREVIARVDRLRKPLHGLKSGACPRP